MESLYNLNQFNFINNSQRQNQTNSQTSNNNILLNDNLSTFDIRKYNLKHPYSVKISRTKLNLNNMNNNPFFSNNLNLKSNLDILNPPKTSIINNNNQFNSLNNIGNHNIIQINNNIDSNNNSININETNHNIVPSDSNINNNNINNIYNLNKHILEVENKIFTYASSMSNNNDNNSIEDNIELQTSDIISNSDTEDPFSNIYFLYDKADNMIYYTFNHSINFNTKLDNVYELIKRLKLQSYIDSLTLDTRIFDILNNPVSVAELYPQQYFNYYLIKDSDITAFPELFDPKIEIILIAEGDQYFFNKNINNFQEKPVYCVVCAKWIEYSNVKDHIGYHASDIRKSRLDLLYSHFNKLEFYYFDLINAIDNIEHEWIEIYRKLITRPDYFEIFISSPYYSKYLLTQREFKNKINYIRVSDLTSPINSAFLTSSYPDLLEQAHNYFK